MFINTVQQEGVQKVSVCIKGLDPDFCSMNIFCHLQSPLDFYISSTALKISIKPRLPTLVQINSARTVHKYSGIQTFLTGCSQTFDCLFPRPTGPLAADPHQSSRVVVFLRGFHGFTGWFLQLSREPQVTVWEPLKSNHKSQTPLLVAIPLVEKHFTRMIVDNLSVK